MKAQRIRTTVDRSKKSPPLEIKGWLDGSRNYLWFGIHDEWIGTLSNQKLYRLALAIVNRFEEKDENL